MAANYSLDKLLVFNVNVTFDQMTLKPIGVNYWSCPTSLHNLRTLGPSILQLLIRQAFCVQGHCVIDL